MKLKTLFLIAFFAPVQTFAAVYFAPPANQSLIGEVQYSYTGKYDNTVSIAQHFDLGHNALESANPHLNLSKNVISGATLRIPTVHLLPNLTRQGIIINLPEMRMYYFPKGSNRVLTYPIGIGKIGKTIPITRTIVIRKTTNPTWVPPEDIREFNLEKGIVLPQVMPPGPDNPLGHFAIYMRLPTYLMHSTPFPESIGTRASFGCIRMYESDIKEFFPTVEDGIPVAIINSPTKVGWEDQHLYIEAHHPLEEHSDAFEASLPGMVHLINSISSHQPTLVDWQLVSYVARKRDGVPHEIGFKIHK